MKTWTLETEQWLPLPRETVFDFFADASNLEALTPPLLRFRVLTPPPITMEVGAIIDYRLSLHGIPMVWRSEITAWQPPEMFVDEQRRGPYRLWRHRHTFIESGGGTLARDDVEYSVHGGAIVQKLLVAPDLKRIFEYRQRQLRKLLASPGFCG